MNTTTTIKFLRDYTIDLAKLPKYPCFKGEFCVDVDIQLLMLILKSNHPDFTPDRKKALQNVIANIKANNTISINHQQKYDIGRFYADNSLSPICLSRYIKHTLFTYMDFIDIDMVKGHPSILFNLAKNNQLYLKAFEKYLENPEKIFKMLIDYYITEDNIPLTDDDVKNFFNVCIYGGGFNTWKQELLKDKKVLIEKDKHPFLVEFKNDVNTITDKIIINNPEMIKRVQGSLLTDRNEYEIRCRLMSYYCCCIENEILYVSYQSLIGFKLIQAKKYYPEYDGLCFKKPADKTLDYDDIIFKVNNQILKKTGLNVKMKFKGYSSDKVHLEIIEERNQQADFKQTIAILRDFTSVSERFEENHCKIINKAIFVKDDDNEMILFSEKSLKVAYDNMIYEEINEKGKIIQKNFISDWLRSNPNQKVFRDIKCFPKKELCPDDIYNSWKPFDMELINEWVDKPDALETILNHIKILCNNEEEVSNYMVSWIAQMIQFPEVKSNTPTLISNQGAGKTTLIILLSKMFGKSKVFEASDPARDIWGHFNGIMGSSFLINLSEMSKKDTLQSEGRIKALITDSNIAINNKGINPFNQTSYHRFIITTNNEDPLTTSKDDRRNWVVKSSNELIGNTEYFNKIYALLDDVNVIKTCYEYFKNITGIDEFKEIPIPRTSYQEDMKDLSVSPIEKWIIAYTCENYNETEKEILGSQMYSLFNTWCEKCGIKYELTVQAFGIRLKRLNINGIEILKHTNKGEMKKLVFPLIKQHLKIENIEIIPENYSVDEESEE